MEQLDTEKAKRLLGNLKCEKGLICANPGIEGIWKQYFRLEILSPLLYPYHREPLRAARRDAVSSCGWLCSIVV